MVEQKNPNKGIIIILVLLVLGLGGYIVYDKCFSKPKLEPNPETQIPQETSQTPVIDEPVVEEPTTTVDQKVEEEPKTVPETKETVIDLGYFSSKNVKTIVYNHNCYLACSTEYEYEWITVNPDDIINVFKTLKKNIVKKISIPEGLGGPGEGQVLTFYYENGTYISFYLMNDFVIVFKNGKELGAWKYSKKNLNDVQKVMTKSRKITILEERPVSEDEEE